LHFNSLASYGTLAFEDLWPSTGDYDFNDQVVDYDLKSSKTIKNL
jgi:LruC domain-containing protein